MYEIKETIDILIARWLEVSLIIGISFLASLLAGISKAYPLYRSWMGLACLGLLLIEILIYLGFLRSVFLESDKRQSPTILLQKGMRFFLRFFGLGLLYTIVLVILVQAIFWVLKIALSIEGSLKEVEPIIARLCWSIAHLIIIRPYLFIPALVIVLDCGVFESFKFLRKCKLFHARGLLVMYGIQIIAPFVWLLLTKDRELSTLPQIALGVSYYVIWHLLTLIIFVMAVRFIASLNLVFDNDPGFLYSEDY